MTENEVNLRHAMEKLERAKEAFKKANDDWSYWHLMVESYKKAVDAEAYK